jgi:sodium-coupled neutral amino acid transporter 11
MARNDTTDPEIAPTFGSLDETAEEANVGLLQQENEHDHSPDEDGEDLVVYSKKDPPKHPGAPPRRQSSFAQNRNGAPRTPLRVRFNVEESEGIREQNGDVRRDGDWMDEEDYMTGGDSTAEYQRAPLLTGIEAPSVTVANELDELELESSRPKSGMRSAFFNMANSIIGAGIIGQPYAFRQAGLLTGITLLIVLTITVDWTIRLIVTNSKLSGQNSFQATMEHCFGKSGLVAISIAQWAFAFGGMVAFCIIIGDTIPRVLGALFPTLHTIPILWLLTNRRAIIMLFVLGISFPLSLYRDIAMVCAEGRDLQYFC